MDAGQSHHEATINHDNSRLVSVSRGEGAAKTSLGIPLAGKPCNVVMTAR